MEKLEQLLRMRLRIGRALGVFLIHIALIGLVFPVGAMAAELVMVQQKACPWCQRWKQEIGVVYNKTEEGKAAPLRMLNIHGPWPEDLKGIPREHLTPTFILVDDGVEIDRVYGYQGEEAFWFHLNQMLKKLKKPTEG